MRERLSRDGDASPPRVVGRLSGARAPHVLWDGFLGREPPTCCGTAFWATRCFEPLLRSAEALSRDGELNRDGESSLSQILIVSCHP